MARHFGAFGLPQGRRRRHSGGSAGAWSRVWRRGRRACLVAEAAAWGCQPGAIRRQVAPGSGPVPTRGGRPAGGRGAETFRGLTQGRAWSQAHREVCVPSWAPLAP